MSVRLIVPGERLGARRGEVVVCIAVSGGLEPFARSLRSVLRHTSDRVPVVLHGAGGAPLPGDAIERLAGAGGGADRVHVLSEGGIDAAGAASAPADVVLLAEGCEVAAGWLERLRAAALSDGAVATVSALPATALALPVALGGGPGLDRAAELVAAVASVLPPRLDAPLQGCVHVSRSAIELVGPGLGAAFADRCAEAGLAHLLAGDVLVAAPDAGVRAAALTGSVARAAGAARRALAPLSVTIDARILAGPLNGTRVHALELIAAVARTGAARVTAIVPPALDERTSELLATLDGLTLSSPATAGASGRADVVHLPHQVPSPADLVVLAGLGERLVVTQQDLIGYHSPSHFSSAEGWIGYRDLTRRALAAADGVVFFSEHARNEALSDGLVEPGRTHVVPIGVDHALVGAPAPEPPPGSDAIPDGAEVILCLGTDFGHKNRPFALRVVAALRRRGWDGRLVLAGPHVGLGSSRDAELALLAREPGLAEVVVDLGEVSDAGREWLMVRAALALCPTVREGFGLVPHEAAARDLACMWAPGTALVELLPDEVAGIVPWDPEQTAQAALALLRDPVGRSATVAAVRAAGERLRWEQTGRRLLEVYGDVCDRPPTPAAVIEREAGLMSGGVSEDAMRLVGPGGLLPPDLERPLLALLSRPRLARPFASALRAGYRASQRRS